MSSKKQEKNGAIDVTSNTLHQTNNVVAIPWQGAPAVDGDHWLKCAITKKVDEAQLFVKVTASISL